MWMDPEFALFARQPRVPLRDAGVVREVLLAARGPAETDAELEVEDFLVPGADEETQVPLRIYRRRDAVGALPVLLYLHGGGFFCGDLFSDELQCSAYALRAQCVVVCVAYRLAPEHPFPAALDDCYRAEVMWRWYLGEETGEVSPYAAPARAEDLAGLPASYLLCAGIDPLRDEGLEYADRLREAGVPVELHLVPSIPHGFASVPGAEVTQRLLEEQVAVLCYAFGAMGSTK